MLGTQRLLFFLPTSSAQAAQTSPPDCEAITQSQQIHQCARLERKDAHDLFNQAFKALNDRVREQWQTDAELQQKLLEQIESAHMLWSTSARADCALESIEIEHGTKAYEATLNACFAQRYRLRETYLNELKAAGPF